MKPVLYDSRGDVLPPSQSRMAASPGGAPYMPDGTRGVYGIYDAVNFNTNRQIRPYFAVDSRFTLTAWSRLRALALARWSYVNVGFVKGGVDLMARLSVGTGFRVHSLAADKVLAAEWDDYVNQKMARIGFARGESMDELLAHDSRSIDVDGDIGYIMTEDEYGEPKLQLVESHRIKNGDVTDPRCRDGVWTDAFGRVTHYNVELAGQEKTVKVPVQSFIFLAERNRPDETRSMTNLIHALVPLQDLYEVLAFEMTSVKKNSEWAAVIETPTPNRPPGVGQTFNIFQQDGTPSNGNQPAQPQQMVTYEQVWGGGGKIPVLLPGEKLQAYNHDRPAPGMPDWAAFTIRGISVGMGLPFEVLWNPEAIGGANTRMITGLTAKRVIERRIMLEKEKLRRVRLWILGRGVAKREIKFHPDIVRHEWNPTFIDLTVDAGRESRERRQNVVQGLDTYTAYFSENGTSYEEQLDVRESEIAKQCEAAQRLCEKFPDLSFSAALSRIAMLSQNESTSLPVMDAAKDSEKSKPAKK